MYFHNLDPILVDFGFIAIRWYSLAYIAGILLGWGFARKIINHRLNFSINLKDLDNLISWLIISIIIGGRLGYVLFYNLEFYINNFFDIFKIWEGGMSFHGALIGVIISIYFFSIKYNLNTLVLLDIIACVAPIGLFFGRIANFINGELYGKPTEIFWSVIFPLVDNTPRHPSQLYEAILEGLIMFIFLNIIVFRKNYKIGTCSFLFLTLYGLFRVFSEIFREPDEQVGYIFEHVSMGSFLSIIMLLIGVTLFIRLNKNEIK